MQLSPSQATPQAHTPPVKSIHRQNRSATYIWLKANIYYFRYAFTAKQRLHFAHTEIRVSLATGFLHVAKRRARNLYTTLENLLMDDTTPLTYSELKQKLALQLEKLMDSCPVKKEISISEIQQRMSQALQKMLQDADDNLYRPESGTLFRKKKPYPVSETEWLDHKFSCFYKNGVGSPETLLNQHYPLTIVELLKLGIFLPEELTQTSILKILNEYQKLQIKFNRIMLAREQGDYAYENSFALPQVIQAPIEHPVQLTSAPKTSLLASEFIEKYISTKLSDQQWKKHSVPTHKNRLHALIEILGDQPIQNISRENMRTLRNTLLKLPPNYKKKAAFKGKTIGQILEMPITETYSIKTVNITLEAIASMLEWGVREGFLEKNNAKSLQIKDERQDISLKNAFTMQDIEKIFFSGDFKAENFSNPAYYWAPLIGLYTGMRLEEICQLYCADIAQKGDIWFFDVKLTSPTDCKEEKLLKNRNAQRQVPIHDKLLELGFLNFVQKVKEAGYDRIFHELKKTASSPKYGKNVGKAFSRYLGKVDIIKDNKSFHSLRHTFSDYFKTRNLHNDIFRQIFGHEIPELASRQYGSAFPVEQCYSEIISKINFEVTNPKIASST